jgi:hypothetical protein
MCDRRVALGVVVALALTLQACGGSDQTTCTTDADCVSGTTCRYGVCGAFALFPPASCASARGMVHTYDYAELDRVLPGCWLSCATDAQLLLPNAVGFGFSTDMSRWWFIVDGGAGALTPVQGGDLDLLWPSFNTGDVLQLNLVVSSNEWLSLLPQLLDGPPLQMVDRGSNEQARYVRVDATCGEENSGNGRVDMGNVPFGGQCNPNDLRATDCPAVGGTFCSMCGPGICEQPCHVAGNECPAPKTCKSIATTMLVMSGSCAGFDGICS